MSERKKVPALLLLLFLGGFGAHRFYVGKIGTAILFMFTFGGAGIWAIVDLVSIISDSFTDIDGKQLQR